ITLSNVLHAPEAAHNLLSISKLDRAGGSAYFGGGRVKLYGKSEKPIATGTLIDNLYYLDSPP
ncbi:hypothetical protein DENSPDRAFT_766422, partial [Dentipellis sp. KUC8613]